MRTVAGDFDPQGSDLNAMWQQVFDKAQVEGQRAYEPPSGVAPYHTGEVPPVACSRGTAARRWAQGAFYCRADGWVVYDELWLREFQSLNGDFAPAAVLAHEWGHHVQSLVGEAQFDIQDELQADCFAGMYLAYRELPPGATVFIPRTDEFTAALVSFFILANEKYSESSWFQADEHGSPFQRMLAFGTGNMGITGGLTWCYGYRDFVHGDVATVGPYRLLNLPGRSESWNGTTYVIEPESRVTEETSSISLRWLPALPQADEPATFEQVAAVLEQRLPGATVIDPAEGAGNLGPNLRVGTGWWVLYGSPADAVQPRSGILGLLAPASVPGGLVIDVSRAEALPADPLPGQTVSPAAMGVIAEQVAGLFQIVTRLCGPDQSADLDDPNWNMACLDEQ